MPDDAFERALVLQWMCFEQYSHEPNLATVRFWKRHRTPEQILPGLLEQKIALGHAALAVMQQHLLQRSFFVAERFSIADIALYAYTQSAKAIGLAPSAHVESWLARVREVDRHVAIKRDPLGKAP